MNRERSRPSGNSCDYPAQIIHGTYYPHIDGIRALAVLPVLLFHVLASLCPGGFAGVDVFFVISGYLITGSILRDLEKGRFTIGNFYHRRIRRILPAYFVLIAGVFAAGCAVYYSRPLLNLGDASIMGTLFSANLYLWKQGGDYFGPGVHGNPLLHLWSLSVEEQFYLFIPLLCALVWRFRRRWVAPALAILAALSLAGAVYAVATGRQSSAFYLLHYRAWELLAGALLAVLPAPLPAAPEKNPARRRTLPAAAGLLLVLAPYAVLSSQTPFPGAAALPSVLGTVLLIRYGQAGAVSRLLAWPPFVAAGRISYSLYLWHWPVTVFWKYAVYDQLCAWDYAGMLLLSLLLAYLSWRFVEMPVRTSSAWTMRRSFAFAAAGMVVLVSLGMTCVLGRGWPTGLHARANAMMASINRQQSGFVASMLRSGVHCLRVALGDRAPSEEEKNRAAWLFAFGMDGASPLGATRPPQVLLLGDSHAGVLKYGLDVSLRARNRGGYVISHSATGMFNLSDPKCQDALAELDKLPGVSKVLLVQSWPAYYNGTYTPDVSDPQRVLNRLREFAVRVKDAKRTLYIATGVPVFRHSPDDIAARLTIIAPRKVESEWRGFQCQTEYQREQGELNAKLEDICRETGAVLVPLHLAFKEGDLYAACEKQAGKSIPLYRDAEHLSPDGSLRAARFIMPYLFPEHVAAVARKEAPVGAGRESAAGTPTVDR